MDQTSQIQALDRTTPTPSMRIGSGGKHTHDYARHRTFTLFSATDIATRHHGGSLWRCWFGMRTAGRPPRTFGSVKELTTKIRAFINGCNTRCAPFVWTNTADQVPTEGKP